MDTWRALWTLARPRLLPYVLLLPCLGYGWAHWDRALRTRAPVGLLLVLLAWALLHAGTLWLNAALDQDEGEVLFGRAVRPPPSAVSAGYAALVGSVALAFAADPVAGAAAAVCAVLAVLYSHPRVVWKGHALGGPFVNLVGYGLLSPLAGWAVVDVAPDVRTLVAWALGSSGVLGAYFMAQAFQREEDAARGYRTLIVTHGPRAVLTAARVCLAIGLIGGVLLALIGWIPRICAFGAPLWWRCDRWLAAWSEQPDGGNEAWARGLASRLLVTALVGLGLALGEYARESLAGEPVAGLGTAAGHPPDRPRLPPDELAHWEVVQARRSR